MKSFKHILLLIAGLAVITSCNDDFLEKFPETALTEKTFFNNPQDLATYTFGLYGLLPVSYDDNSSDNLLYHGDGTGLESMIRGEINPDRTASWDWSNLRKINFFLDNASKAQGDQSEIDHYIGIGRFFRAIYYTGMVKTFGDVPWYDHALSTDETEELYKARDPRTLVMDKVMEDLEFAVTKSKHKSDATIIGKYAIEALAARIALEEGTFRKYHTELNLGNADKFLQKAAEWSKDVMDNGGYSLVPMSQFAGLFNDNVLASRKEIILYKKHSKDLGVGNNTHTVCDVYWGMSQSLVNSFLNADGTRFTDLPGYDKKTYVEVFQNRDPRLSATIVPPGAKLIDETKPHVVRLEFGGYPQYKFYPARKELAQGWNLNFNDLPIVRLAEVYLIYAEAKAELGTISQADLDLSVNKLRTRASLPSLSLATANTNIDPILDAEYNNVTGSNKGLILEIRRERRVELACEGLRKSDLFRWKLGKNMIRFVQQGCYFPQLGPIDLTGDGQPDAAILAKPEADDKTKYQGLILHYLVNSAGNVNTFYLENGTSGHIQITGYRDNTREFIEPKYYFYPIPTSQVVLNPNLKQMYGW